MFELRSRRVYDEPEAADGARVLTDGLWPRGVSKERAALTCWRREAAPSPELRRWYGHEPEKFAEFRARYRAELAQNPAALALVRECGALLETENVTIVYAARDGEHSNAAVLCEWMKEKMKEGI